MKIALGVAIGILLTIGAQAATTPCASEDSTGPCYWNASERGNHEGHSFVRVTEDWQVTLP